VGGFLGDVGGAVGTGPRSEVVEELFRVDRAVLGQGLGQVEHTLELPVVGVVLLVAAGGQVEVAAALVCIGPSVLSAPKISQRAFFSPHQAATRQSPITPPR
jgi:hypothetical protein